MKSPGYLNLSRNNVAELAGGKYPPRFHPYAMVSKPSKLPWDLYCTVLTVERPVGCGVSVERRKSDLFTS